MSHPRNKRERFVVSELKGKKRADAWCWGSWKPVDEEQKSIWKRRRRNVTAPCSCSSCGNPRRSEWSKGRGKLTLQEQRFEDFAKLID